MNPNSSSHGEIVLDVNMRVEWKEILEAEGFDVVRWRDFADRRADDDIIMRWAADNGRVVFTQDLDFSSALAQLKLDRPSVVLLRTRNNETRAEVKDVVWLLRTYSLELDAGALLVIDPAGHRVRKLPYD